MAILGFQRHAMANEDRASAASVAAALTVNDPASVKFVVTGADGRRQQVEVPPRVVDAIRGLAGVLAESGAATFFDEGEEVSPERAADLLGISRPTVVQRINQGQLRARMVGAHHRIRMSDLVKFQNGELDRASALEEFGEQTDELTERHGF